jgi:Zn-finger nucleic acid-binding protein
MTFRDDTPACPHCRASLSHVAQRLCCETCGGTFVSEAELTGMLDELSPDQVLPLGARLVAATAAVRKCPRCDDAMVPGLLFGARLDRCPGQHGVWFDRGALEQALLGCTEAVRLRVEMREQPAPGRGVVVGLCAVGSTVYGSMFGHPIYVVAGIVGFAIGVGAVAGWVRERIKRW